MPDLSLYSNEELLELARERHLIDLYRQDGVRVELYVNGNRLTLSLPQVRVFLSGLMWGSRDLGGLRPVR